MFSARHMCFSLFYLLFMFRLSQKEISQKNIMMNKKNKALKRIINIVICFLIIFAVFYPCILFLFKTFYIKNNFGNMVFSIKNLLKTILIGNLFWNRFFDSVYYTILIVVPQIIIGTIMAFVFAKFDFPLKNTILFIYLILLMIPFQVTMVSSYITLKAVNLLNTPGAVILPQIFLPFGVLFLRYIIIRIPNSIIDSAKIDGASTMVIFFKIIIPSVKNGIILLFFFSFIDNWNLVEPVITFNKDSEIKPLSVVVRAVMDRSPDDVYAAGLLYMLPALIIFILIRNNIIEGMDIV